jgi:hypothetical protein
MWAAGMALAVLVLFLCYLRDAQTVWPSSDSASIDPARLVAKLSDECFYGSTCR